MLSRPLFELSNAVLKVVHVKHALAKPLVPHLRDSRPAFFAGDPAAQSEDIVKATMSAALVEERDHREAFPGAPSRVQKGGDVRDSTAAHLAFVPISTTVNARLGERSILLFI